MSALPGNAYYAYFANQLGGGGGGMRVTRGWGGGLTPLGGQGGAISSLGESVVRHGASVYHDVMPLPGSDTDETRPEPKNNQTGAKVKINKRKGRQAVRSQRGRGPGPTGAARAPAVQRATAGRAGRPNKRPRKSPAESSIRDIFSSP